MTKAENGLIISWVDIPISVASNEKDNVEAGQVDIYHENGQLITSFNVLRPVDGARAVSIYDVSAQPGGPIAVAAVYVSEKGDRNVPPPAASLVLFDFKGRLLSAYALSPARQIRKLVVDERSNVWTLTENFVYPDSPNVPMVVEYTAAGTVARELLPHNMLQSQGSPTMESLMTGMITMGSDSGVVWFWLPGSTDLVMISESDGSVTHVKTELPKRESYIVVPLDVARESSGEVVGVFREEREDGKSNVAYYAWSPLTRIWSSFNPGPCEGERLLGISNTGEIYEGRGGDICSFRSR
ncbi:MAG: hypothetical protein WA485_25520 [Candidatus Sulfotelmatobacter sp.]